MPSNRSNSERGKAFDIDTKIEYMNKLYEVRESNSCCDCSLATICSSSNISAGDRNDDALSRDKRINIFGECSSLRRLDKKSVVFVEIPKDDSKDNSKYEYYKISPLWVYNNPTQLRPIEVVLPNGHEIDVESSDLSKGIIRFRRKWLTIEQLYKLAKENNHITHRDSIKHSSRRTGYVIPYNFPLNTRRGFRTIYYLMRLSQHDMTTVIKDIIAVRHAGINFILNICDKLEKENNCMLTSLRGG